MTRVEAVPANLRKLLGELTEMSVLAPFSLGGGTSLALRFGHRKSIDIDLFTLLEFDSELLLNQLRLRYPGMEVLNRTPGSLCLGICQVKVDLLHHAFGELAKPETVDGVRCVSLDDLAAMKINAVTNRGSKKDFSDLLQLHVSGLDMRRALENYCCKYGPSGRFLALRSLQFFDDARLEPDPVFLNNWTWSFVEEKVKGIVTRVIAFEGT